MRQRLCADEYPNREYGGNGKNRTLPKKKLYKLMIRVLVVGCGNMGASHAKAYQTIEGFEICGLVSSGCTKEILNKQPGGGYPLFSDYEEALRTTRPDAVCISTYPDTHEAFCIRALEMSCHVFVEKNHRRYGGRC